MASVAVPIEAQDILPVGPSYRLCHRVRLLRGVDANRHVGNAGTGGELEHLYEGALFTSGDYRVLYRKGEIRREDLDGKNAVVWTGIPEDAVEIEYAPEPAPFRECTRVRFLKDVACAHRTDTPGRPADTAMFWRGSVFTAEGGMRLFYRNGELRREAAADGPLAGRVSLWTGIPADTVEVTWCPAVGDALSAEWGRFLAGHWTLDRPTKPGTYRTCPRECPAGSSGTTTVAIEHPTRGIVLTEEWRGWFWSEPLPRLPDPPDCPTGLRRA